MKTLPLLALVVAIAACSSDKGSSSGITTPPDTLITTIPVVFPGGTLTAKIAATEAARSTGLMNATLGANNGMLFIFGTDHDSLTVSFWMKDTPIDLSIAFIAANMTVVNVDEMVAEDSITFHKPKGTFRYAIEANKGWMTAHGVAAGTTVNFAIPAGTITDP